MLRLSTCYMRRHEPSSHELLCEKGALKVMEAALHSAWRGSAPGMDDVRVQRAFEMQPWVQLAPESILPEEGPGLARAQDGARQAVVDDLAWAYTLLFALTGSEQVRACRRPCNAAPEHWGGDLAAWRPLLLGSRQAEVPGA